MLLTGCLNKKKSNLNKPSLLYASPFWPQKSGISEYSHNLVTALSEYWDITLLIGQDRITDKAMLKYPSLKYKSGRKYTGFDAVLYNIGNQPYYHGYMVESMKENPGFMILHDFSLYYLTVGVAEQKNAVLRAIYREAGVDGILKVKEALREYSFPGSLLELKQLAADLPLNRGIITSAKGVLTHSEYTKNLVSNICPEIPVQNVNLIGGDFSNFYDGKERKTAFRLWGIPEDAFVVTAAGFIAPTKQNVLTCRAVKQFNATHNAKLYYLMAGDGNDADAELDKYCIKTGFLSNENLACAIARADVVFNLRFPTNGETSLTLIQALQAGKVCVITDIGWFAELPNDIVIKVAPAVSEQDLSDLLSYIHDGIYNDYGSRAKAFIENNYSPNAIAKQITTFLL